MEKNRLNKSQTKKLIEKRAGICEIPNCYNTENLVVHHKKRVHKGGTNEENNLLVLCEKHHKMVHSNEFK